MPDLLQARVAAALGDQYLVEEEIGRGGMSVVYRARDRRLDRLVAIKVLPPELAYDPAIRTRFTREAQTSAQLSHPSIIPIHDVGDRDGIAYFVMAYADGGSLASHLAREPRVPVEQVRRILREVADALDHAHQHGVVHRDIKPDNVLLDAASGRTLVTDFGIARAIEGGSRVTVTGIAVGTPAYMSPEQAVGEREVDGRSDIYSLGVVAYQMLTGRVPFAGANSMALLLKHVHDAPTPIAELRPDTPRALREAVERALSKDADERWPTAGALRDALTANAAPTPWRSEPSAPRFVSPRRGTPAAEPLRRTRTPVAESPIAPALQGPGATSEPMPLTALTAEQRADLRLWYGRVDLLDRVKALRAYALGSAITWGLGIAGFALGLDRIPPLVLAPIVPIFMTVRLAMRARSLRASGLRLRRVFLMPRAAWALPKPAADAGEAALAKAVPQALLESPQGTVVRRAFAERSAIHRLLATLTAADRGLVPDIASTSQALFDRVVQLAHTCRAVEESVDWRLADDVERRCAALETTPGRSDAHELSLIQRQRDTYRELGRRRDALRGQLESAALALTTLHLDLVKFRTDGPQASLSDVSMATQEARALSRDIDTVLAAAAEARAIGRD